MEGFVDMKITWLGQAGYLIVSQNASMIIDPYFTDSIAGDGFVRLYPPDFAKGELKVDIALSTHNHGDHLDVETLRDYVDFKRFYGPGSCVEALKKANFAENRLNIFDRGDCVVYGDFRFTGVFADHTSDSIGYVVECEGKRLYFSGDTVMNKRLYAISWHKPDIMFVCINGKFGNMNWSEAVSFTKVLGVKTAIPMHYDMFGINMENPKLFTDSFIDTEIHSVTLERAKEYDLSELV